LNTAAIVSLIVVGAVAVFTSVTAPLILAWRTEKMHTEDRAADWARQDAAAAAAAAVTNGKLDVIHTLVNSNMTAAMQAELDAIRRELAMMREVVALNLAAGREPTMETLAAIEATEAKITELSSHLAEREAAARRAEQQQADEHREPG
jgi:methanogenic corrinoid protein MtbC1